MVKGLLFIYLFQICCVTCIGQHTTKINYGDNPATGKYYNIRGIKMYCEIYGSGKPLLMIHGNGGNIKSFENNIAYFSKKYKVILTDSRSQGKTRDRGDSLSFEMMADDEAVLLDSLHINAAYVIGWSDGGINALLLAMRHPKKVLKLACSGANLWPDSTAVVLSVWKKGYSTYNILKNKIIATFAERNMRKIFMLDWLQPHISLEALQSIKCPSLIIGGDHDVITVRHTTLIYESIPHAYLWIVPNSGHRTLIEHKDEFNKYVDEFFSSPFRKR